MHLEGNINLPTLFLLHNLKSFKSCFPSTYSNFLFCLPLMIKGLLQAEISAKMFCNFESLFHKIQRYKFTVC